MRKGSLKLLLSAALFALGTVVYAASPVLSTIPVVIISDAENMSATEDWNLFVFTDAFSFADYVSDADTPTNLLKWTFDIGSGTGALSINDIVDITSSGDDPTSPANPINGSSASATFREIALSPGLAADPITVPFATPSSIPATMGQDADINGDTYADKLVGELAISFMVADDQNDIAALGTGSTFVWTYDNDLGSSGVVNDALKDNGLPFVSLPLDIGTATTPAPGTPDWYYRNWSGGSGGAPLTANWLTDAVSGTVARFSAFQITGAGTVPKTGSFNASYGEWISPGDPTSLLAPGKVYGVRAAFGLNGDKVANDQPRIGVTENTVACINQTYVVNAPSQTFGVDSPFLPAVNSTRQYLNLVDPIDADVTANTTIENDPATDLYYLFNFDFVNYITVAVRTATLTSYEVGPGDAAAYNANESAVMTYGGGTGENGFDDWGQLQGGSIPLEGAGQYVLTAVASHVESAGSIVITTTNKTDNTRDISFVEIANFLGAGNIDDVEVVEDAAYRLDYSIAMTGGTAPGVTANPYGIPALRLRTATPIPSYSIEMAVTPRSTNAFPTEGVDSTISMYFTASSQYPSSTTGVSGEENDSQLVFGVQDLEWTDGTATLDGLVLYQLSSSDPNVDY